MAKSPYVIDNFIIYFKSQKAHLYEPSQNDSTANMLHVLEFCSQRMCCKFGNPREEDVLFEFIGSNCIFNKKTWPNSFGLESSY